MKASTLDARGKPFKRRGWTTTAFSLCFLFGTSLPATRSHGTVRAHGQSNGNRASVEQSIG